MQVWHFSEMAYHPGWEELGNSLRNVIPSRVYDPVDILFNTLAAVMAVGTSYALAWARRRPLAWLLKKAALDPDEPRTPHRDKDTE